MEKISEAEDHNPIFDVGCREFVQFSTVSTLLIVRELICPLYSLPYYFCKSNPQHGISKAHNQSLKNGSRAHK